MQVLLKKCWDPFFLYVIDFQGLTKMGLSTEDRRKGSN